MTRGWTDNQIALLIVAVLVGGACIARAGRAVATIPGWLQERRILTPPGTGLVDLPHLGGLDLPRLTIIAGLMTAATLAAAAWRRSRHGR